MERDIVIIFLRKRWENKDRKRKRKNKRLRFVCKMQPMNARAGIAVLIPVSMVTWMCCRCSDASLEHCVAWATRANAQLTAASIRLYLFIAPKWWSEGTRATWSSGQRGQVSKPGWVQTQTECYPSSLMEVEGCLERTWEEHIAGVLSLPLWSLSSLANWPLAPFPFFEVSKQMTQVQHAYAHVQKHKIKKRKSKIFTNSVG